MDVLDRYIKSPPSNQNAVDIFKGDWSSQFPEGFGNLEAGTINLFEDPRVRWAIERMGGVEGKRVLELGPLEASHTYMLERAGAAEIVAIEANTKSYLKCLIVKETMGLKNARFLCGDCMEYLRDRAERFDICFASGILYHMVAPAELLAAIAKTCDRVFIWTHYYDGEAIARNANLQGKFGDGCTTKIDGFSHTLHRYEYQQALDWGGFCGGSQSYSHWMEREEILNGLRHFGFTEIVVGEESSDHPHGPCFNVVAMRFPDEEAEPASLAAANGDGAKCPPDEKTSRSPKSQLQSELDENRARLQQVKGELRQARRNLYLNQTYLTQAQVQWGEVQAQLARERAMRQQDLDRLLQEREARQHEREARQHEREAQQQALAHLAREREARQHDLAHLAREREARQYDLAQLHQERLRLQAEIADRLRIQAELNRARTELLQVRALLMRCQETIAAIKTSKFWKLRLAWQRLKTQFGFSGPPEIPEVRND